MGTNDGVDTRIQSSVLELEALVSSRAWKDIRNELDIQIELAQLVLEESDKPRDIYRYQGIMRLVKFIRNLPYDLISILTEMDEDERVARHRELRDSVKTKSMKGE